MGSVACCQQMLDKPRLRSWECCGGVSGYNMRQLRPTLASEITIFIVTLTCYLVQLAAAFRPGISPLLN